MTEKPPARLYKPGPRNPRHTQDGRMGEYRHAWVNTVMGQLVILEFPHPPDSLEPGSDVVLQIPRKGTRPYSLNVSACTHEELLLVKEFFKTLFDLAEPVTIERDKVAQDAWDSGDDSFARSYRQVPQFVVRPRPVAPDGEGVRNGSEDAAARHEAGLDLDGGVRGPRPPLASGQQDDPQPEDDKPQAD